jgi:hypothetical protein
MKKVFLSVAAGTTLLLTGAAFAASDSASGEAMAKCPPPAKPEIPNGRTATEEQMLAAQKAVKTYQAENGKYTSCLASLEQSWGDAATEEQKAVIVIFHNRAIDEETGVADLFNQAVRAFKGKNQGS